MHRPCPRLLFSLVRSVFAGAETSSVRLSSSPRRPEDSGRFTTFQMTRELPGFSYLNCRCVSTATLGEIQRGNESLRSAGFLVARTGVEPVIFALKGRRVNHYSTGPHCTLRGEPR